jgi:SAM-dependent methyltransferase
MSLDRLNQLYAQWMGWPLMRAYYANSGFFNVGYWPEGTHTQLDACRRLVDTLLAAMPCMAGHVLDVACGNGGTVRYLLDRYSAVRVVGINISPTQTAESRQRASEAMFLRMDATALGFRASSFDAVLCIEAAFHFRTRLRFFHEAYRVLKPDGYLLLSDMLYDHGGGLEDVLVPPENRLSDVAAYRALFAAIPFTAVHIEDARDVCWNAYCSHLTAWGRERLAHGEITTRDMELIEKNVSTLRVRHYLLATAQKPHTT